MATSFSLSRLQRERYRIQFSDLAPSLQAIINGKVDKSMIDELSKKMDSYKIRQEGMVLSIGTTFPTNPVANKNVHINSSNRIVYFYTSSGWKSTTMEPIT